MSPIVAVASNTFRQCVRQRLFYNVVIFGVGMILLSMAIGNITFGFPDRVVRSIGLSGVTISLDLIALLLGVTLIHQEVDKKTLFVVLTRPVRRWQYVTGRYLGLILTLTLTLIGFSVVFILALLAARGAPSGPDFVALMAVLPEMSVLAGIGITLSAFSTPTLSAGIGLGIWIAAATTDDLVRLSVTADEATKLLAKVTYYALPSLARFNFRDTAIYKLPIDTVDVMGSMAYGIIYSCLLVAVSSAILSRREMI